MPFSLPLDPNRRSAPVRLIRGGDDFVVPTLDIAEAAWLLSEAPLAAGAAFVQDPPQRRLSTLLLGLVRGVVLANQPGTLTLEESLDGAAWTTTATLPVSAGLVADTGWLPLARRDFRFRYTNGATPQGSFALYQAVAPAPASSRAAWTRPAKGRLTVASVAVAPGPTLLLAGSPSRLAASLANNGGSPVYLGRDNTVTVGNGFPLTPGATLSDDTSQDPWYGVVAAGAVDVRVLEVA